MLRAKLNEENSDEVKDPAEWTINHNQQQADAVINALEAGSSTGAVHTVLWTIAANANQQQAGAVINALVDQITGNPAP